MEYALQKRKQLPGCSDRASNASSAPNGELLARRVAIESVRPEIDGGRFAAKRIVGDLFLVEADIFTDGHERLGAALLYRRNGEEHWREAPMQPLGNDRWAGSFVLSEIGSWFYSIAAWRDPVQSWCEDVSKKLAAGRSVSLELTEGRELVAAAAAELDESSADRPRFLDFLEALENAETEPLALLRRPGVAEIFARSGPRHHLTRYERDLEVWVDRKAAGFSAWYEITPRSQSTEAGRHGTFDDVIARLPYVREMGFDVLYLTPIHPIGRVNRKGRNNALTAQPGEPGSPYAIGSEEGGHDAIHPDLGTFADFARLVERARSHGLEIALDFAIQCAPDHPWVREHAEWFDWRPDGSLKHAENPPKKYEDIVNVHFYGDAFPSLWFALRDVVLFWVANGVRIFRVDNPHTKPFPFWEWLIREVHERHPEVIFLSEAFTRPKVMRRLAKLGFSQSYSYFTWRNTKQELTEYLLELTLGPAREYMRPNFFTNTPDINPYYLQTGGRAAFQVRLLLAATLAANYGVYNGFELCEAAAIADKEEYANSEKYELKVWDWERSGHIRDDIRRVNALRRTSPALQVFDNVSFYNAWNEHILYYGKSTPDRSDFLLFAVNLDPHTPQGAHFEVPLWEFGLADDATIEAEDLVVGRRFTWSGKIQHMWLDPKDRPYMIWRLSRPQGGSRG
jgi:starch synthase (maltosyl-transferring)